MRKRFPSDVLAAVAVGGAAGTLLRAWVAQEWPPPAHGFPWDTLVVNVAGSLILGFAAVFILARGVPSRYARPLIGTGFCGGLTTMSTFVVEVDLLLKDGRVGTAALYVALSVGACLAAARVGMALARTPWARQS